MLDKGPWAMLAGGLKLDLHGSLRLDRMIFLSILESQPAGISLVAPRIGWGKTQMAAPRAAIAAVRP
jgi:hypothetical protein